MISEVRPRHVVCVLGTGLDLDVVEDVVRETGSGFTVDREYSANEPDPRMPRAFEACMAAATFTEQDWRAVEEHDTVAYVLSPPMTAGTSAAVSRMTLQVTAALLEAGATAAKNESNGLAHGRAQWLDLARRSAAEPGDEEQAVVLAHAWVKRPILDGGHLYSCGMHLLGHPDVELEIDDPDAVGPDQVELMDALAIYLMTERRALEMRDGEGFRLAPDAPRWILRRRECRRYDEDDFFFKDL
ncbi:hypothetical protein [Thermomonospora amylolytica]|uniref:hypothetical protein n=1 Tax=Thermomonospora amylolytica TaxID=1411117 RepID=UPI0013007968|nr:hypothetical protein [Thermomonospora amylolytica]